MCVAGGGSCTNPLKEIGSLLAILGRWGKNRGNMEEEIVGYTDER